MCGTNWEFSVFCPSKSWRPGSLPPLWPFSQTVSNYHNNKLVCKRLITQAGMQTKTYRVAGWHWTRRTYLKRVSNRLSLPCTSLGDSDIYGHSLCTHFESWNWRREATQINASPYKCACGWLGHTDPFRAQKSGKRAWLEVRLSCTFKKEMGGLVGTSGVRTHTS